MEPLERIALSLEHIECFLSDIRELLKQRQSVPLPPLPSQTKQIETPLLKLWNELAHDSFPRAVQHDPNSTRTKNTVARWLEKPDEDHWKKVILKINASDWCRGSNPTKWVADFDFFIKPDVHYKAVEGKYDNKRPTEEKRLVGYTESEKLPVYQTIKR